MTARSGPPPARAAALDCLTRTLAGQDLQAALDQVLTTARLAPRDAALATELCYGFLRLKGRHEYLLSTLIPRPEGLPDPVRLVLGLAVHELLGLDKVPDYAAVDWAVEETKRLSQGRLAGLANAVLRKVPGLRAAAADPRWYGRDHCPETVRLSRYHSCPGFIVKLWLDSYGPETAKAYLAAQTRPPALGLRYPGPVPPLEGVLDLDGPWLALSPNSRPDLPPGAVRQSYAARQALLALNPESWPTPVWDACAGRGGKTRHLLELGLTPILASDVHRGRIRALRREYPAVPAFIARADQPPPLAPPPASILLDVPCSGLGVLSRRPDTKWKRSPADLAALARIQTAMLDASFNSLPPGGRLAYLTCTLNPAENEAQWAAFLARTPAAKPLSSWTTPPSSPLGEFFFAALAGK